MQDQLFEGCSVEVYVEEHYKLSALYTPRRLMEEYGDSICSEISSYSPVMGIFFRDARIDYPSEEEINIYMTDSCISRSLQDRLEESLNRIFRDRCGVRATLTVNLVPESPVNDLKKTGHSDHSFESSEPFKRQSFVQPQAGTEQQPGQKPGQQQSASAPPKAGSGSQADGAAARENSARSRTRSFTPANGSANTGRNQRGKRADREYTLRKSSHPDVVYGREITADAIRISDVIGEIGEIVVRGQILANDRRDIKNGKTIVKFSLTDFTDSICCKLFVPTDKADELLKDLGKGSFVKVRGAAVMDTFDKEVIISSIQGIMKIPSFRTKRVDDAPVKRIELHCHTKMSDMDGVSECKDLVKLA